MIPQELCSERIVEQTVIIQVLEEIVEIVQIKSVINRIVDVTVVVQRQTPTIQTVIKTVEILQVQFRD